MCCPFLRSENEKSAMQGLLRCGAGYCVGWRTSPAARTGRMRPRSGCGCASPGPEGCRPRAWSGDCSLMVSARNAAASRRGAWRSLSLARCRVSALDYSGSRPLAGHTGSAPCPAKGRRPVSFAGRTEKDLTSLGLSVPGMQAWMENPRVGGSIPPQATRIQKPLILADRGFFVSPAAVPWF